MNPVVDKLTDPTFTNSSKGLMTLFCIGLAQMVIGVELTDTKIAIPWFPTINFLNPQNLVLLYWGVVAYAMYRYILEHHTQFRKQWFHALAISLRVGQVGENFVRKNIYLTDLFYDVKTTEENGYHSISITTYEYEHSERDVGSILTFKFSTDYKFELLEWSENPSYSIDEIAIHDKPLRDAWGLEAKASDVGEPVYLTTKIASSAYRFWLARFQLRGYVRTMLTSREVFDLTLPLVFNFSLFLIWAYDELSKVV
ncbi:MULTISPECIES: hypothetical protein [Vibrio]|uniref:hypothetical protein n=1 Tax=Vibrio TaxID=662 RepID=UPI000D3BAE47|nr:MULTISPECIES: hypothetical protein [Vibrio]PTO93571.1 hypothetical protein CWO29_02530 [Vibrio splendidus]RLQ16139.1 hypothetical protein AYK60_13380 [Vibrio sp. SBT000027]